MSERARGAGSDAANDASDPRRIVVVGPCASGKSTLVEALRGLGYDAHASGQEHSEIADLWRRSAPDVLIALKVELVSIQERRGSQFPAWLHDVQNRRLRSAFAAADLTLDTTALDPPAMIAAAIAFLNRQR